jgi:type I restriction enzyme S subunit
MTRSQFFQHFDLLADQPDAVAKMRELVLELAVRGKLVSNGTQADKDGAWTKFCAEATAKNSDLSPAFNVPSHWRWARLEDVAAPCGQKKPDARFTYVDVGAIDNERGVIKDDVEVIEPENAPSRARKLVAQNSVIFSTVRPYLKNIAIVDRKFSPSAIVSTAFAVLHPMDFLQSRYLYHWLRSRPFQGDVESKMKGVAYPAISDSELWQCLIPVPPPAEQRRIVAKVDELMALCDELEQRQQARQHASGLLQQSALHHLLAAREPQTFAAAWQRVRDHFHLLHDTPDAIPQLRQTILQLAVQGRLVPQNPKDEPASDLLAGIRHRKERLVELGKIEKEKQAKARNAKQTLFSIPETWQWARLSELTEVITKGSSPKWQGISYVGKDEGVLFITSENVGTYELRKLDDLKYVEKRFNEIEPRSMLKFGDILMNLVGASIGRTAVYSLQVEANINQAVALIRLMPGITDEFSTFLIHYLNSPAAIEHMLSSQVVNAQPNISLTDARDFPVPIPPLAEQKRIVARVEELLRRCDTLEAQLHQTRTLGAHLLASTLHHLLAA